MNFEEPYALIACDVQHDFLPGGVIPVPGSDETLLPLSLLARKSDLVILTRDWHPDNHFSFSEDPQYKDGSWPPHCIQKTRGARIHSSLTKFADFVISKGTNRNPPDVYSAFAGKTLRPVESLEEILGRCPISTIIVGGLTLDYCVKFTALDANALGYRTIIPLNTTRPMDDPKPSLATLARAGVEIVENL